MLKHKNIARELAPKKGSQEAKNERKKGKEKRKFGSLQLGAPIRMIKLCFALARFPAATHPRQEKKRGETKKSKKIILLAIEKNNPRGDRGMSFVCLHLAVQLKRQTHSNGSPHN